MPKLQRKIKSGGFGAVVSNIIKIDYLGNNKFKYHSRAVKKYLQKDPKSDEEYTRLFDEACFSTKKKEYEDIVPIEEWESIVLTDLYLNFVNDDQISLNEGLSMISSLVKDWSLTVQKYREKHYSMLVEWYSSFEFWKNSMKSRFKASSSYGKSRMVLFDALFDALLQNLYRQGYKEVSLYWMNHGWNEFQQKLELGKDEIEVNEEVMSQIMTALRDALDQLETTLKSQSVFAFEDFQKKISALPFEFISNSNTLEEYFNLKTDFQNAMENYFIRRNHPDRAKMSWEMEVNILKKLETGSSWSHWNPYIVRYEFYSETDLTIGLEWCDGGDLFDCIETLSGSLDVTEVQAIVAQVTSGLEYMHSLNIMHGDVKPGNILFSSEGLVKLCDFNFSLDCAGSDNEAKAPFLVGSTKVFAAPECFMLTQRASVKIDVWQLGYVMLYMALRDMPFSLHEKINENNEKTLEAIDSLPTDFNSTLTKLQQVKMIARWYTEKSAYKEHNAETLINKLKRTFVTVVSPLLSENGMKRLRTRLKGKNIDFLNTMATMDDNDTLNFQVLKSLLEGSDNALDNYWHIVFFKMLNFDAESRATATTLLSDPFLHSNYRDECSLSKTVVGNLVKRLKSIRAKQKVKI